jgi:hypothetical protein
MKPRAGKKDHSKSHLDSNLFRASERNWTTSSVDHSFILTRYWKSLVLALLKRSRIEGWVFNHLCHNIFLWLSTNFRTFEVKKIDGVGVSSLAALENVNFIFLILNSSVIV